MENIVYGVMIFSLSVLIWGTLCLIYSSKAIRAYERNDQRDETGL